MDQRLISEYNKHSKEMGTLFKSMNVDVSETVGQTAGKTIWYIDEILPGEAIDSIRNTFKNVLAAVT